MNPLPVKTMQKATVFCIDDDKGLQFVVQQYLEGDGYKVITASSGQEVDSVLDSESFDAVLLDLMLPDAEGFVLLGKIRSKSKAPVIIVSGKSDTTEKIVGLEMGADDYMTKPFEMRELSARIKAVLRRSAAPVEASNQNNTTSDFSGPDAVVFNGWKLDRTQYQLFDSEGNSADLTTGEFKLLEALVMAPNRALSREHLFTLTRDGEYDVYDRAIDIQIARIRKKLGDAADEGQPLLKTVRGVGYMFCGKTENA